MQPFNLDSLDNFTVFTNNAVAIEFFEHKEIVVDTKWFASTAIEVLKSVKTAVRNGSVLVGNPLSGVRNAASLFSSGTKPPPTGRTAAPKVSSINPYISLLITKEGSTVDFQSVKKLDEALDIYKKNARLRFVTHNDEAVKNFQILDLEGILLTLSGLSTGKNLF